MYGSNQMRRILAAKDGIAFPPATSPVNLPVTTHPITRPDNIEKYVADALKIVVVGAEVSARVLNGGNLITEEEVEVTDLYLDTTIFVGYKE